MAHYTPEQVDLYLKHINLGSLAGNWHAHIDEVKEFSRLALLQGHHLARVPFDSIALHYSPARLLSLHPEDLFRKIVLNSRGGYCMEVNALFGNILRSMGYDVISVGGRVKHKKWSHMVNIVTVDDRKYLVDVGFGAKEPKFPVSLDDGFMFPILGQSLGRVDLKHLEKHSISAKKDPNHRLWVYSTQSTPEEPWEEMYSFTETEFFPEDFEMMNYFVSTRPDSWFVQEVIAYRMLMDGAGKLVGEVTLRGNVLTVRQDKQEDTVTRLGSEHERVEALETYFSIRLTEREERAITGLVSEIKQ